MMMEPKIRLKGFSGEWTESQYGSHINSVQTGTNLLGEVSNKGIPLLKMGNIQRGYFDLEKLEYLQEDIAPNDSSIVKYGDFYYNTRNTMELVGKGATWMNKSGLYAFNSNLARCKFNDIDTFFFNYLYNTREIIKQVQARAKGTTSVAAVYLRDLESIRLSLPTNEEQKALATFFTSLDNQISAAEKRLASLKQVKAASLQAMFPQEGETTPKLRFKGCEGEWKKVKLGEISDKVTQKNLKGQYMITLTNSAEFGVVSQRDFFDHDISNTENIQGYYVVENGSFVYNPRISVTAPFGPINKNKLGYTGVMSPLYYVFRIHDIDEVFLEYFFKTSLWHKFMKDNGNTGARFDRLSISDDVFEEMPIFVPSLSEQRQIASYFTTLDRQISVQSSKISKLKQIKSACLDQMFV